MNVTPSGGATALCSARASSTTYGSPAMIAPQTASCLAREGSGRKAGGKRKDKKEAGGGKLERCTIVGTPPEQCERHLAKGTPTQETIDFPVQVSQIPRGRRSSATNESSCAFSRARLRS